VIQPSRIRKLNERPRNASGAYVLYWMQASQRARGNPALETAIRGANRYGLPVVVGFGLTDGYPEANARHYAFMLEGLADCAETLAARGIAFAVRRGAPDEVALSLARDAAAVICDRGYMPVQTKWRERVAEGAPCAAVEVEGDVVVPVETASAKSEHAARTLRPRIHRLWDEYLVPLAETEPEKDAAALGIGGDIDVSDPGAALARLDLDRSVPPVKRFRGGLAEARRRLARFRDELLPGYAEGRNEPAAEQSSLLSPYLHFGQISPVEMALAARDAAAGDADRRSFVEELVVRRELAINYVRYEPRFDRYDALPGWARKTLGDHAGDPRPHLYDRAALEACETHDPCWNAAMAEMVHTGFMHNYMRMYWAKKILEWSRTPEEGFETTLALNNRYFLDGRDPNSYANVAWCYGLHDRGWPERPVFGKVRYMNEAGLRRKFDMEAYVGFVDGLIAAERD
jgi:deoxyribodipyrimidine photo-lyase